MKINFEIKVKVWKDKATNCWIYYSKKYDVSAYGKTKAQAKKMFLIVVSDILIYTKPKATKKRARK
ncbi:MAG: hypothetical protein AABY15_06405 [Nanoarchaeota archaeon]